MVGDPDFILVNLREPEQPKKKLFSRCWEQHTCWGPGSTPRGCVPLVHVHTRVSRSAPVWDSGRRRPFLSPGNLHLVPSWRLRVCALWWTGLDLHRLILSLKCSVLLGQGTASVCSIRDFLGGLKRWEPEGGYEARRRRRAQGERASHAGDTGQAKAEDRGCRVCRLPWDMARKFAAPDPAVRTPRYTVSSLCPLLNASI